MRLSDFAFLTDENIQATVVKHIKSLGFDVWDVKEKGYRGTGDAELLKLAYEQNRIVVTHDSDFGTLAFREGFLLKGIIYLRPGHFDPKFTIISWDALVTANLDLTPPFILVAQNQSSSVKIRLRQL